jgi:hypothetical protein
MGKRFTGVVLFSAILAIGFRPAFSGNQSKTVLTAKKGIAMARFGPANAAAANASWYYDWNNNPRSGTVPAGQQAPEFVPQIWGANNVTTQNINALKTAQANGTYTHLLGFNEPDMAGQANMTVSQAISLWPQLMSTGLILGSPAPSYTNTWFSDFMTQAAANNLRVDFICLHTYRPPNVAGTVAALKTWIQGVYNQYKKPIWLTEFGAPDCATLGWCGTAPALTQAQVDTYTGQVIAMLEDLPCVERYAWFVDASQAGFELSALFKSDGTISQTGIDFRDAHGTNTASTKYEYRRAAHVPAPLIGSVGAKIVCTLPANQVNYRLSLFDAAGRTISCYEGVGSGEVRIDKRELNCGRGVYLARLEMDAQMVQARIVLR